MTLANAIRKLMKKGVTNFPNWAAQAALDNANSMDEIAMKVIKTGNGDVKGWQYHIDHADDNFIVEFNGHFIIATRYQSGNGGTFEMATYGDYETEKEMYADFEEWQIQRDAAAIADEKAVNRTEWDMYYIIAIHELRKAMKAAKIAFEQDFPANEKL